MKLFDVAVRCLLIALAWAALCGAGVQALEVRPVIHFSASSSEINPGGFESVGAHHPTPTEYFVEYPVYLLPPVVEAYLWFQVLTPYNGQFPDAKIRTSLSTYEGDGLASTSKYGHGELWGSFLSPQAADPVRPLIELLDVTSVVQQMQQADFTFGGFKLHDPLLVGQLQQIGVLGPRFGDTAPLLLINQVPEPAAGQLLALGGLLWAARRRFWPRRTSAVAGDCG